jgi:hypothetical protein
MLDRRSDAGVEVGLLQVGSVEAGEFLEGL